MARKNPFAALMTIAQDQQGYFTTKQAIGAGYADNTHPYHVRNGDWERVWRGIYRVTHLPSPEDGQMMMWLLWSRGRDEKPAAVVSHQSALSLFELGDFNPANIHLTVPPTFRRNSHLPKAVTLHHAKLMPGEVTQLRGLSVCRPLRALCDLAEADPNALENLRHIAKESRRRGLITESHIATGGTTPARRQVVTSLFP